MIINDIFVSSIQIIIILFILLNVIDYAIHLYLDLKKELKNGKNKS